jgi:hypothetical protein
VVFGSPVSFPAALTLSPLIGGNGFTINGVANFDQAGFVVSGAGDVNGDGIDDLLLGASYADAGGADRGQAYLIFGRSPVAMAVGPDKGGLPLVKVYGPTGALVAQLLPYPGTFTGGVRVAVGNVIGDDQLDVVMAPGAGLGTLIQVFDGGTRQLVKIAGLFGFLAYAPNYLKGAGIAVGDIDSDGIGEIVVSPDKGPNRRVKIFNGNGSFVSSFFPYGAAFKGGVRVAVGDTEGTAAAEIITVKASGKPTLRVFNAAGTLLHQFNVLGNFVAVGNVDADAQAEIIVGSNAGQPGRVRTYHGITGALETTLKPYETGFLGGIRVSAVDGNGDGRLDILTAPGKGRLPEVKMFDPATPLTPLDSFFAYDLDFKSGLFVAGA